MDSQTLLLISRFAQNWILGFLVIIFIYFSQHRDLLKIDLKAIGLWALLMTGIAIIRIPLLYLFWETDYVKSIISATSVIQWPFLLGVWWEDAVHVIPLALFSRFMPDSELYKNIFLTLTLVAMMAFGLGHLYQGWSAVLSLSLYIPLTLYKSKTYGFGTIMVCHMIFDFTALATFRLMIGIMS